MSPLTRSPLPLLLAAALGCVAVPAAEPLPFAVDDDQLRGPAAKRELAQAARALLDDPDLHLRVIGHADEDNTEAYNRDLSLRRAEHVRARILAQAGDRPELAARIEVEARSEWDARERGTSESAKARNRRVELRFYYPRSCEPRFDASFLACEWARLPPPTPPDPPEPPPEPNAAAAGPPPPAAPRPARQQSFRGGFLYAVGGYAIASDEYLRQHGRWGVGGGYVWGFESEFRIAVGMSFDHLIDAGFLFPESDSCAPFCEDIERSRLRLTPELRVGGASRGIWGWLRVSAGLELLHRERVSAVDGGEIVERLPERWFAGAVFGLGPAVAIALTQHLFLLVDATATFSVVPQLSGGAGIDTGLGLGWVF